ncbi:MAG: hypothetical protein KF862_14560 [Chitinophagaceae bacterium]|nr:hypothetical protein [Chitinophagaceae bacterium]
MEWATTATGRFHSAVSIPAIAYRQQTKVIYMYLFVSLLLCADRWWNGMLLSQLQPAFFVTPMNVTAWALMFTGIHELFMNNQPACLFADLLLVAFPVMYTLLHIKQYAKAKIMLGGCMLVFNFVYAQCYTLYPSNSIEGHIGWMLFPVVLMCHRLTDFSFALQVIRFVFLFFLATAGVWKIRNGGIFNPGQMSGVLLLQHSQLLATAPSSFLAEIYYWLISHPAVGYLLYLAATLLELFFIVGFFTRKADRWLLLLLFIFLITDILVMRIKYWEIMHLAIPLFFSRSDLFAIADKTSK